MASTAASLTITGTELERSGQVPLIALTAYNDAGRVVSASVVDPVLQQGPVMMPRDVDEVFMSFRVE